MNPADVHTLAQVREIGLHQKQSAAWGSHLVAATLLESNVMFNMPLTAIGFNDGARDIALHSSGRI